MKMKRAKNGARLVPRLSIHLRLYDEYDHNLRMVIEQEARKNERSIQQQIRYMLRRAAEDCTNA